MDVSLVINMDSLERKSTMKVEIINQIIIIERKYIKLSFLIFEHILPVQPKNKSKINPILFPKAKGKTIKHEPQ